MNYSMFPKREEDLKCYVFDLIMELGKGTSRR